MKRISVISLCINGFGLTQAAAIQDKQPPPDNTIYSIRPCWSRPRNDEKWQGSGKRRKPRVK